MKTPTLEEVRERFKDAKIVQDWTGDKIKVTFKKLTQTEDGSVIQEFSKKNWCVLFHNKHGYAKILSYKEPKEKTFLITKEQLKQLRHNAFHENTQLVVADLDNWFSEVFETKLTVGKWYKSLEHPKQIIFASDIKDVQHIKGYGFNTRGDWESCDDRFSWGLPTDGSYIEATEQEVTEALTKEAVKRGFKEGVYMVDMYNGESEKDTIQVSSNRFDWEPIGGGKNQGQMALRDSDGNILFHNGKFAEIITTITIQEAEAKLKEIGVNAKIV